MRLLYYEYTITIHFVVVHILPVILCFLAACICIAGCSWYIVYCTFFLPVCICISRFVWCVVNCTCARFSSCTSLHSCCCSCCSTTEAAVLSQQRFRSSAVVSIYLGAAQRAPIPPPDCYRCCSVVTCCSHVAAYYHTPTHPNTPQTQTGFYMHRLKCKRQFFVTPLQRLGGGGLKRARSNCW